MECDKMTALVIGCCAETKGNFHRLTNDVTLAYYFACLWYLNCHQQGTEKIIFFWIRCRVIGKK